MPELLAILRAKRHHRIELADFSEGRALCSCGEEVHANAEPRFDRDEALAAAWQAHRREVGAKTNGEIGYDRDGRTMQFRIGR